MKLAQINFNDLYTELGPTLIFGRGSSVGEIINHLLPYLFVAAGLLLLLYLIYGGITLMFSGGDPKAVQGAKSKIGNALIGFIVIFFSYWIVQFLGQALGLFQFQLIFR